MSSNYEQSLVFIKPDGVARRLSGRVIQRFEDAGLKITAMAFRQCDPPLAKTHYAEHVEKDFYPSLERYVCSGPVLVMVIGGNGAIGRIRKMVGATVPAEAEPGTIRGDFAHQPITEPRDPDAALCNLVHASANAEDAKREIAIWFTPEELLSYALPNDGFHGR